MCDPRDKGLVNVGSSHWAGSGAHGTERGTGQWLMHGSHRDSKPVLPAPGIQLTLRIRVNCYSKIRHQEAAVHVWKSLNLG